MSELNEKIYEKKKEWHRQQAQLPIKEKMRICSNCKNTICPSSPLGARLSGGKSRGTSSRKHLSA